MRKNRLFILFSLLALAAVLTAGLLSCENDGGGSGDETDLGDAVRMIVGDGGTEYAIVRSDFLQSGSEALTAIVDFKKAVLEATGVQLEIQTDWVDRGTEPPSGTKEILIGSTNRPESKAALAELEGADDYAYIYKFDNDRLVIAGVTNEATASGVYAFMKEYLGYNKDDGSCTATSLSVPENLKKTGTAIFELTQREDAIITLTPSKYADVKYSLSGGKYLQSYDAWPIEGVRTTLQVSVNYNEHNHVNCDSVMLYSTSESMVNSWFAMDDVYSIDMMIAINRAGADYFEADESNYEDIQMTSSGGYLEHPAGGSYYMVPTLDFIEYIWEKVEWSIYEYKPVTISFEEPEMWNSSGYSQGFKDEWKLYFGEEWEEPNESAEAMLKSMELKTYLFERIIIEMSNRIKAIAPNTKLYIASHSTVNYNAWGITSGLNQYLATGKVEGVIGQTWSDTVRSAYPYMGTSRKDDFLNAFVEYASYCDSVQGTNFFALADPMSDNADATEVENQVTYLHTVVASLMQSEIHRFEIMPWLQRAFGAVSSEYRTELQQVFNALNELGGKATVIEAGTPGIGYAVSDTVSWLKDSRWSISTSSGLYGVSMPLITAGIPLKMKAMEQIVSASDLEDTELLIISYDNMLPMDEAVNAAIADWVKAGGTLLCVSGSNDYWDVEGRFWTKAGSPLEDLFDKLGLGSVGVEYPVPSADLAKISSTSSLLSAAASKIKVPSNVQKYTVHFTGVDNPLITAGGKTLAFDTAAGSGRVIAVGLPSSVYANVSSGCTLMKNLTEYALGYTDLKYVEANLMVARRGDVVAAHAISKNETLSGTYLDLFNQSLPLLTDPVIKAGESRLFYQIHETAPDKPVYLYGGGELQGEPSETADKTEFSYIAAASSTVSFRLLAPEGRYPQSVTAVCNGLEAIVVSVWNNDTHSLLLQIDGAVKPTAVTVNWGDTPVSDTDSVYYEEVTIRTNNSDSDSEYLILNTAASNGGIRYCDQSGELVYRIDISKMPGLKCTLSISQNYIVELSADGENWTMIADYSQGGKIPHIKDAGNGTRLGFYPQQYDIAETLYIRIRNSNTSMGWGAALSMIMLRYRVDAPTGQGGDEGDGTFDDSPYLVQTTADGTRKYSRTVRTSSLNGDSDYLVSNTASSNEDIRFCDQMGEVLYYFDLRGTKNMVIRMSVYQNYIIEVCDEEYGEYTVVADYSQGGTVPHITTGNNRTVITVNADKYGFADGIYVRLKNSDIQQGWGGTISQFVLQYERPAQ